MDDRATGTERPVLDGKREFGVAPAPVVGGDLFAAIAGAEHEAMQAAAQQLVDEDVQKRATPDLGQRLRPVGNSRPQAGPKPAAENQRIDFNIRRRGSNK